MSLSVLDKANQGINQYVWVTVMNARLSIGPSDITFSDPAPEIGDMATIFVTVRNTGDSTAHGVTIELFDHGDLVFSFDEVDLEGHSVTTFPFEVSIDGEHLFSARARSILYDTGEMPVGKSLKGVEEESEPSTISDSAAWIGMLAIVLAVIAIALNLIGRMRTPALEEMDGGSVGTDVVDDWEETPDEEK